MHGAELRIPPDPQFVSLARLVVVTAARRAGMDEERVEDLRIAVSEATTNAIRSHGREGSEERVVLTFGAIGEDDGFEVTIADSGGGFTPLSPDELAGRPWTDEGGLGVTLIRGLADDVEFVQEQGMHVSLRFAVGLRGGDDAEGAG
jgi:serine/threonine-protein kinase RsbW